MLKSLLPVGTSSADETARVGWKIGRYLQPGQVVALYGDLGSGKTQLAKGICSYFGVPERSVTSPTFTLINEYRGASLTVFHFDMYRLDSVDSFMALGYEDYFFGDEICIVEWPDLIESLLPDDAVRIRLSHSNGSTRRIELETAGDGKGDAESD